MSLSSKLIRVFAPVFSLTLLSGYVIYSHVTPNSPPPDPLGLSIDLTLAPEVIEFDSFIDYGSPLPSQKRSGEDLRIITSKNISQPIFSTKNRGETQTLSKAGDTPSFWARLFRSTPVKKQRANSAGSDKELRIIGSKVINQPVFSVRKVTWGFVSVSEDRDSFAPHPRPFAPPEEERVVSWLAGFEMTGLSLDPLRRPAAASP